MRKRGIIPTPGTRPSQDDDSLDLVSAAMVEVTSEEKNFPVEAALALGKPRGWRAAKPGPQTIGYCSIGPKRSNELRWF
jgi:hypothetical protein